MNVSVLRLDNTPYPVLLRPGTEADREGLVTAWAPMLDRGPDEWFDKEWNHGEIDQPGELVFPGDPLFLVIADEVGPEALRDLLGFVVITGPVSAEEARLDPSVASESTAWTEYIAIAPGIRPDCPAADRRQAMLKGVGPRLMLAAIARSREIGCSGRIGLHAEGQTAVNAYTRWQMAPAGRAPPEHGGYPMFSGSAEWAASFEAIGRRGR